MNSKKKFRADIDQTKVLVKAGKNAAQNAVRQSNALELSVVYIDNGIVCERSPDGTIKKTGEIALTSKSSFTLVKGMILHGKG